MLRGSLNKIAEHGKRADGIVIDLFLDLWVDRISQITAVVRSVKLSGATRQGQPDSTANAWWMASLGSWLRSGSVGRVGHVGRPHFAVGWSGDVPPR